MPNHWDPMPNNNKKGFIRVTLNKSNIFPGSGSRLWRNGQIIFALYTVLQWIFRQQQIIFPLSTMDYIETDAHQRTISNNK